MRICGWAMFECTYRIVEFVWRVVVVVVVVVFLVVEGFGWCGKRNGKKYKKSELEI